MYKFNCYECKYKTNLKGDYKRHLNSRKHKRNVENTDLEFKLCEKIPKGGQKRNKKEQKGTFSPKKGTFWEQKGTKKEQKGTFLNFTILKENDISINTICDYCNKKYATRKTLLRHIVKS